MASVALVVSACIVTVMTRRPCPWTRFLLLRWLAGAIVVLVLAYVGRLVEDTAAPHVGLALAALLSSTLASVVGCSWATITETSISTRERTAAVPIRSSRPRRLSGSRGKLGTLAANERRQSAQDLLSSGKQLAPLYLFGGCFLRRERDSLRLDIAISRAGCSKKDGMLSIPGVVDPSLGWS
jgi:hypothetical protein